MKLDDLLALAIPVAFFLFWGSEYLINRAGGGQPFQPVRGWFWVGVVFFLLLLAINAAAPLWLPMSWMASHRLMNLTAIGLWGAPLTFLLSSFINYVFHRAEHRFDVLWRGLHQMHHSIERVDMAGFVFGHPLETLILTGLGSVSGVLLLGVTPESAAIGGTAGAIVAMFQHWNVSTPRWLGYLLLRPEQHCLHHERDVHARNYSADIALWDLMFGSFANTDGFAGKVGFGRSAIRILPAMLVFANVDGLRSDEQ